MKKNFSFSFNSNLNINGKKVFSSRASDQQDLTPQQEYWFDRLLRDYSGKVFFITVLFIVLLFSLIFVVSQNTQNQTSRSVNLPVDLNQ